MSAAERPVVRLYVGLPASGKTTDALAWIDKRPKRHTHLSRDNLRYALYGKRYGDSTQEDIVTAVQESALTTLLSRGQSVAVDDTNLDPVRVVRFVVLAARACADVEVVDYTGHQLPAIALEQVLRLVAAWGIDVSFTMCTPVTVDECVDRDRARPEADQVGEDVIRGMYGRYLARIGAKE